MSFKREGGNLFRAEMDFNLERRDWRRSWREGSFEGSEGAPEVALEAGAVTRWRVTRRAIRSDRWVLWWTVVRDWRI